MSKHLPPSTTICTPIEYSYGNQVKHMGHVSKAISLTTTELRACCIFRSFGGDKRKERHALQLLEHLAGL